MTHKTDPNDFAFAMPITYRPDGEWMGGPNAGLTKRELFAMHAKGLHEDCSTEAAVDITGIPAPAVSIEDQTARRKWWIRVDAVVKVMQADALIAALNGDLDA